MNTSNKAKLAVAAAALVLAAVISAYSMGFFSAPPGRDTPAAQPHAGAAAPAAPNSGRAASAQNSVLRADERAFRKPT
ncbi:MAG: hypothetical protein IBJ11_06990 [Phycisphaerales bacterium]|nr:hypothetical protein [Phycisphaerales bacterium]